MKKQQPPSLSSVYQWVVPYLTGAPAVLHQRAGAEREAALAARTAAAVEAARAAAERDTALARRQASAQRPDTRTLLFRCYLFGFQAFGANGR